MVKKTDQTKPSQGLHWALEKLVHDPLGFVHFAYPWESGVLKGQDGPDAWQTAILKEVGDQAKTGQDAIRHAVSSGHGPGKTALCAWLIHWFLSTRPHPQVVVTANTRQQLVQKTWRELSKWHKLSLHQELFEWTSDRFYLKAHPSTWFAAAVAWSKERPEAFAGTHEKHVMMIFDEASLIEDAIWEVSEGAMTSAGAMWFAFGNPTRNTGRFRECWGRFRHRWRTWRVDSRTAKMADRKLLDQWVQDYGEDSDFVRVRVRGMFPRASSLQFIGSDLVRAAEKQKVPEHAVRHAPVVLGVDVARFGDDESVVVVRQGLSIRTLSAYREMDVIALGNLVANAETKYRADAVFIDEVGIGAGVVDYLRSLGRNPIGVNGGRRATRHTAYYNLRAEMWARMKKWLEAGGSIPADEKLFADLEGLQYGFDARNRLKLEKKEDLKSRGLASPDRADALSMTFAADVEKNQPEWRAPADARDGRHAQTDYDVFGV